MSSSAALRVLVVDDELLARERLRTLLGDCGPTLAQCVGLACDAQQAVQLIGAGGVDAVLLDIHMPGTDGLGLARQLRSMPQPPSVVFVTAHTEHALEAFELDALDYLTKPVRLERLQSALAKVQRARQGLDDGSQAVLLIQDRGRVERVALADVLYFKAELKYLTVRTAERSYILEGSLNDLEQRYASQFMRVHRNALVARQAMRALERHRQVEADEEVEVWTVSLRGVPEPLVVSRRLLSAVRAAIAQA